MECLHTSFRWEDDITLRCNLCGHRFYFAGDGSLQMMPLVDHEEFMRRIRLEHDLHQARVVEHNALRLFELYEQYDKDRRQAEEAKLSND